MPENIRTNQFTLLAATLALFLVMSCSDHGLAPIKEGYVSGTIRYLGQPPASTVAVLLAFYHKYPPQNRFLPDDTLLVRQPYAGSTMYNKKLLAGRYEWVALGWIPITGQAGLDTLGMYYDRNDSTRPGAIEVVPDDTLRGIDILADFSRVGPAPFLKPQTTEVIVWQEQ